MRDSAHFSAAKMSFIPLMELDLAGIGIEATMRGQTYFDLHFGISSVALRMSELETSTKGLTKVRLHKIALATNNNFVLASLDSLNYLQTLISYRVIIQIFHLFCALFIFKRSAISVNC